MKEAEPSFRRLPGQPRYENSEDAVLVQVAGYSEPFRVYRFVWENPELNPRILPYRLGFTRSGTVLWLYRDAVYESTDVRGVEFDLLRFVDKPPPPVVRRLPDAVTVEVGVDWVVIRSSGLPKPYKLERRVWDHPNGPRWLPTSLTLPDEQIDADEVWLYGENLYTATADGRYGPNDPHVVREIIESPIPLARQPIPPDVQRFVWQRDSGACVNCGGRARLEFDHIVPLSLGGSSTARNLQLLCESCNRAKGRNLGQ